MCPSSRLASLSGVLVIACWLAGLAHASAQDKRPEAENNRAVSVHLDDASLPDPAKSPGDVSRDLLAADLCDMPIEDFAQTPPKALCDELFDEAGLSAAYRFQYTCVFLVPPSIGGTQSRANLWLQPAAEAPLKRIADAAARKHVCRNPADLANAQLLLERNWVGAYRTYLLPGDKLAPIAKLDRGPDDFGRLPPAPPEEDPDASFGGAGVPYRSDPAQGYNNGGGASGFDDRRRQRPRVQGDRDRREDDGRGVGSPVGDPAGRGARPGGQARPGPPAPRRSAPMRRVSRGGSQGAPSRY